LILTEIEEMDSFFSNSDFEDFALYTPGFTDVLAGLMHGDAVGGAEQRR